jgi:hypothetical protein
MSTLTLTKLSVGLPEMDVSFFDSLPTTLRQLEVGISDISFRQPVMDRLSSLDGRLRHLRKINFNGIQRERLRVNLFNTRKRNHSKGPS